MSLAKDTTYNGWKNYETWNVALWLQNDYPLYQIVKGYKGYASPYLSLRNDLIGTFNHLMRPDTWQDEKIERFTQETKTKDGVSFFDPKLDIDALDEMINEE